MSKCGLCGDENMDKHMILKCRVRNIPKNLYDRMCVWMANEENPKDHYESFEEDVKDITSDSMRQEKIMEMAEIEQTEEAMDIMYELTQIYQRGNE